MRESLIHSDRLQEVPDLGRDVVLVLVDDGVRSQLVLESNEHCLGDLLIELLLVLLADLNQQLMCLIHNVILDLVELHISLLPFLLRNSEVILSVSHPFFDPTSEDFQLLFV